MRLTQPRPKRDTTDDVLEVARNVVTGQSSAGVSIKHDVSVPVDAVPEFIARALQVARDFVDGVKPLSFGHVGDGNIHITVVLPEGADRKAFVAHPPQMIPGTHDIVLELGGSISTEYGIGLYKRDEFERLVNPVELRLFRRIKDARSPDGRLNPGVLLREIA